MVPKGSTSTFCALHLPPAVRGPDLFIITAVIVTVLVLLLKALLLRDCRVFHFVKFLRLLFLFFLYIISELRRQSI